MSQFHESSSDTTDQSSCTVILRVRLQVGEIDNILFVVSFGIKRNHIIVCWYSHRNGVKRDATRQNFTMVMICMVTTNLAATRGAEQLNLLLLTKVLTE
ncbi:hypothetical protein D3C75_977980 [compost metagenome]